LSWFCFYLCARVQDDCDVRKWPTASVASIRLPRKVSGAKLPDSSGSPHLSDIKGLEVCRAAVGKFVMDVGTVDTLQQAWRSRRQCAKPSWPLPD
jgi:hypothetical protein